MTIRVGQLVKLTGNPHRNGKFRWGKYENHKVGQILRVARHFIKGESFILEGACGWVYFVTDVQPVEVNEDDLYY